MELCHRDWRLVMSRQGVDFVMTLPKKAETAAEQSAWLHFTRTPLRSIVFELADDDDDCKVMKHAKKTPTKLAVSTRMLAASEHTLEVRADPLVTCGLFAT